MGPKELHDATEAFWKASGLELECNRESAIKAKIAVTKGLRAAWGESWATQLRSVFAQTKMPSVNEPMPMSFSIKSSVSPAREMLGKIRCTVRDIENEERDREVLLAYLAQEIHDVLKSDDLAPVAREWVEGVRRKYIEGSAA